METSRKIKYSGIDRLILGIAYVLLGLFVLSIVIPLIYVVLASFMDPTVLNNQGLSFRIKDWTFISPYPMQLSSIKLSSLYSK